MRVLIVHNTYQNKGGEDTVVGRELALLKSAGIDASLYSISNDIITSVPERLRAALAVSNPDFRDNSVQDVVRTFRPNIVHIHNTFPLLGLSVQNAASDAAVPVVQTLHNYRYICAAGTFLREGIPCTECVEGSPYRSALYGCYRGAHFGSLAVANGIRKFWSRKNWEKTAKFIALTGFMRDLFVSKGITQDRIVVRPNWSHQPTIPEQIRGRHILYVGRLSAEKGIDVLVDAVSGTDIQLRVIGDGPLFTKLQTYRKNNIELLGALPEWAVQMEMKKARALVIPSLWFEGHPLVSVEAMAAGLPIVATRMGGLSEIVVDGLSGILVPAGDVASLRIAVQNVVSNDALWWGLSRGATEQYHDKYSSEAAFSSLMAIYQGVLEAA